MPSGVAGSSTTPTPVSWVKNRRRPSRSAKMPEGFSSVDEAELGANVSGTGASPPATGDTDPVVVETRRIAPGHTEHVEMVT